MKLDEFAFLNQQLAGMLKAGIPLQAALRQLCAGLRRNRWGKEFEQLHYALSQGVPLEQAIEARDLPDLYKQMVKVGAKTNDLPGLLNLLADHYQKTAFLWTRLKGLMLYPAIVLLTALGLSILLARIGARLATSAVQIFEQPIFDPMGGAFFRAGAMMPVVVLGALAVVMLALLIVPKWRAAARWCLPGFKDAHLARLASSLNLLLKSGADLGGALGLMRRLESGSRIGRDLALWEKDLSQGRTKFSELAQKTKAIPPLFFWLVAGEGEDVVAGFSRAAEIYYARAVYKTDLLLNSALPVSILALGIIIIIQLVSTGEMILKTPRDIFWF